MRKILMLTSVLCTQMGVACVQASAEQPFSFDHAPGQLPKTVVPSAYRIDIATDLEKLALTGDETIDIDVREATNSITLNQAGLKLAHATLDDGASAAITQDDAAQTATLHFENSISKGRHTLRIAYTGPIPETPNGIYYDDYKNIAGAPKRMLVTQFEVADARRMFPGWDEPAFKAIFKLSVTLKNDLAVVSNMPVASSTPAAPGLKHVVFGDTPRMSTYLLALIAGDMAAIHNRSANADIGVWAPTGAQSQGDYALHVASEILPYYNEYFGVAYPLPKLDLVAIPGNYAAGAMENWGAITFIDSTLLFDTAKSSPSTRETVYLDVAHEMAHQWSGDLVTMGWWDNIWLNEGFATWMEVKATDHFNPTWEVWPRQHQAREEAMTTDAQPTTHPIQQVIHDISEAETAFDNISYQKGEQVIRMVEDWIGPDVFRDGMRAYMKAHAYGNATSADLWASLGKAADKDVAAVARTFTEQPGIPLVHVARSCSGDSGSLTLTQDRFTIHDPHPAKLSWQVPVSVGAPGGPVQRVMLGAEPATVKITDCTAPQKANIGEAGYYRSQYDAASLAALKSGFTRLAPTDRANLLGDQYALFRGNRADLSDYLHFLPALSGEQDIAVWEDTIQHLASLDHLTAGSPVQASFRSFARKLLKPEMERLGWTPKAGESFLDALLRPELISLLGRLGDPEVTRQAASLFEESSAHPGSLAPSLRAPVLGIVGRQADQATWDKLRQLGEHAPSTEEKLSYFNAMGMAQDPALIRANVAFSTSGAIPNGRIVRFLYRIAENSDHPEIVWNSIVAAKPTIVPRLSPGNLTMLLPAAASGSSDPSIADALLADPGSRASIGARLEASKIADAIRASAELKQRAQPALETWLGRHS